MIPAFEDSDKVEYIKEGISYTIFKGTPPVLCISGDLTTGVASFTAQTREEAKQIFDNA